jgi:O-antigen/teichoic acid export membrane protein
MGPRVRDVLREVAPLAAAVALTAVITRVHVAFINLAEGDEVVAEYLLAFSFIEQVIVLAGIVAGALLPILAHRARTSDLFADAITRDLALATTALGALGSAALIALAYPLCLLIGGDDLAGADRYLVLLSPMVAILLLAFLLGYVHLALGLGGRYLRINLVALAYTVAANASLTLTIGAEATARIAWSTELVVIAVAYLPVWRSGAEGRRTAAGLLAVIAICVAGAELTYADVLAPAAAAALVAAGVLALEGRRLAGLVRSVLRGSSSTGVAR